MDFVLFHINVTDLNVTYHLLRVLVLGLRNFWQKGLGLGFLRNIIILYGN